LVRIKTKDGIRQFMLDYYPGRTIDIYAPFVILKEMRENEIL